MTHTEAADLILGAIYALPMDSQGPGTQAAILAAVATVMDAAREDAFREAAERASFNLALEYATYPIRALAKSSAQENKGASK